MAAKMDYEFKFLGFMKVFIVANLSLLELENNCSWILTHVLK